MVPAWEFRAGVGDYPRIMLPTDFAREVIPVGVAIAFATLPILVLALLAARLTGRGVPRWFAALAPIFTSVWLGYALLVSDQQPWLRGVGLLGVALLVAIASRRRWFDAAGLVLVGAALPWAIFAGAWLLNGVVAGRRVDLAAALPPFATSMVAIAVGLALVPFHRQFVARHPPPPPPAEPSRRRWDTVARTINGPDLLGITTSTGAAIVALFVGSLVFGGAAHSRPILETIAIVIGGTIATGLVTTLAWAFVRTPRSRRAFEAFAWLGEWELERFRGITGGAAPVTLSGMKEYVRNTAERADDRWMRTDILAAIGELERAHDMAGRIPDDTPYGRVERTAGLSYVDWLSGGPGNTGGVRDAAHAILPIDSDERLRAEVVLAAGMVRDRVTAGDPDPGAPLREARDRLGRRADGVLLAVARRVARAYLVVAGAFIAVVTIIDRAATS
jgi:hypothetical protein